MNNRLRRYIGDKDFYKMVFLLVIPMIIQQGLTSFVNLLDNVMIGALGTAPMSGVAISNQLLFVFNLSIFGALSGAGIFGAQFFGVRDYNGMRNTLRFKLMVSSLFTLAAMLVISVFGAQLAGMFLNNENNSAAEIAVTLQYSKVYFAYMIWGLPAFILVQCYAGTLRECGQTRVPMIAGIAAILVNLVGNYILIFGHLGLPAMGVAGAALATVLSRYVEAAIVVVYAHRHAAEYPFIQGLYAGFSVPRALAWRIIKVGFPLFINEFFWSMGQTAVNQSYSTRGVNVVAAISIQNTVWQIFSIIMMSMGSAVSILVGQQLGAGNTEKAVDTDRKLLTFTVLVHILVGGLLVACSGLMPRLYNTEPEVRQLATRFLIAVGASLPIHSFIHGAYFTIRSGGRTIITLLFDSVYTWCVPVALSFALCRYTGMGIVAVFTILQFSDLIKVGIAIPMLKPSFWARNLIEE